MSQYGVKTIASSLYSLSICLPELMLAVWGGEDYSLQVRYICVGVQVGGPTGSQALIQRPFIMSVCINLIIQRFIS